MNTRRTRLSRCRSCCWRLGLLALLMVGLLVVGLLIFPPTRPLVTQARAFIDQVVGFRLYQRGDLRGALEKLQRALPLYQQTGHRTGESTTLVAIGMVYSGLSEYEQALACLEQALPIVREKGDQAGEAGVLMMIGGVYGDLSEYEQALAYLEQALLIYRDIGHREGEARTLCTIGTLYYHLSGYEQALAYLEQALPVLRESGERNWEAKTLTGIGLAYQGLSDYEQALAHFEQALSIAREIGNWGEEATALSNIGGGYFALSNYEQALAYFEQALHIIQEIGNRVREAANLNNIGTVYHALSDYGQALAHYRQALAIAQEIGNREGEAGALNNIGMVYHALSDYEQALVYFEQVLPIAREVGNRAMEAGALNNIGLVYSALSDYEQALVYFEQALPVSREIGDQAVEARVLGNIGQTYQGLSNHEQALTYYQQGLRIQQEIGDWAGEAATLNDIGVVYCYLSNREQALAYLEQALRIVREINDRAGEASVLGNLAALYKAQGQEEQALQYTLKVIDALESIHGELKVEALQVAFAAGKTGDYHRAVRLLLAQGREAEAFHYAERGRARTFLTLLGNQRVNPKGSEDADLIQREAQLRAELSALERQLREEWGKPEDKRSQQVIEHITANLEARRQEYEQLLTQLQLTNPEYVALVSINPLTLEEAQALLQEQAPDVTLVSYFVGEEETVIFVVGPETFHTEVVTVAQEKLRHQAEALLAQMKAEPLLPDAWQEPAQALYEWLIAPVQEYLPPANPGILPRLGIIPHDLLHYLPFGLLCNGESTLLDGYTLFYAPSVSSLEFIFEKRHPEAETLLPFANPDAPGAPHLSYAVEEARAVAALYRTRPFIGAEATEGRFKAQARGYGLVHIAAHSDYNPHNPLFSAILLQADETEDGRLETHEVFSLDLPQTDLVVLSACQTHLGERSAGDELVGLERAFLRAGSPSLLTTLWPVDDAATAALMERFYTHLRAGLPKAEALRLAQIESQVEHPEPYYWAGFVLVGDAGEKITGTGHAQQWLLWASVGLVVILVGVAAFWQRRWRRGPRGERAE